MNNTILIVSAVYSPEPVVSARLSCDIYNKLKSKGCFVKVFHPQPTRPEGFCFENKNVSENEIVAESYTCPKSSLLGRFRESISFGKATYNYIKNYHFEIKTIYANTWPLFAQYYLVKAAKKYGIDCYIHIQDIYPDSYCHKMPKLLGNLMFKMLLPIDKYVLRNSKGVVAISPAMIDYLSESRNVEKSKFTLVRNWQDDKCYIDAHKPIERKDSVIKIMYLGSINPTADISLIINAISQLDREQFHLSIIGNGPEKEKCQILANQLGLDVSFETIAPTHVAIKQREADVLVLCLKKGVAKTATPSKLTSYMLTGRPIIASVDLDSDCANIIKEANCGLIVEPGNVGELSKAIKAMSEKNENEMNSMGDSALKYALKYLSMDSNLEVLTNLILSKHYDRD